MRQKYFSKGKNYKKFLLTGLLLFAISLTNAQTKLLGLTATYTNIDNGTGWAEPGVLFDGVIDQNNRVLIGNPVPASGSKDPGATLYIDLGSDRSNLTMMKVFGSDRFGSNATRGTGLEMYIRSEAEGAFPTGDYWDGTVDNAGGTNITPDFTVNSELAAPGTIEYDLSTLGPIRYIAIRQPNMYFLQLSEIEIYDDTVEPVYEEITAFDVTYTNTVHSNANYSSPTVLKDGISGNDNRTLIGDDATAGATIFLDLLKDYTEITQLRLYDAPGSFNNPARGSGLEIYVRTEAEGPFPSVNFWTPTATDITNNQILTGVNCVAGGSRTDIPTGTGAFRYIAIRQPSAIYLQLSELEVMAQYPLIISETSFSFDETNTVQTFDVTGTTDLTGPVTLTAPTGIALSHTSITKADALNTVTVTATFNGTTSIINQNITISSTTAGGAENRTINVLASHDSSCFTALFANNLVSDPTISDLANFGTADNVTIANGESGACGAYSALLTTTSGAAAFNTNSIAWLPNTTYRVKAMVKTVDGAIALKFTQTDSGTFDAETTDAINITTSNAWQVIDRTFTTGANPTPGAVSFNSTDVLGGATVSTLTYIDNLEVYNVTPINVASGITVTSTTTVHERVNILNNLIDSNISDEAGDGDRVLIGDNILAGASIYLDLGAERSNIDLLRLFGNTFSPERGQDLEIYVSNTPFPAVAFWDGTGATQVAYGIGSGAGTIVKMPKTSYQYIAIRQPNARYLSLNEIQIIEDTKTVAAWTGGGDPTDPTDPANWGGTTPASDVNLNISATENINWSGNVTVANLNVAEGATLISSGTITGTLNYTVNVPTSNWYLISSPVIGQNVDEFIAATNLASGTAGNVGLSNYNNANSTWSYYPTASGGTTETFTSGYGKSIKLNSSGSITFTGTFNDADANIPVSETNSFNLIGNPYLAPISISEILNANTSLLDGLAAEQTVWMWDQSANGGAGAYGQLNLATSATTEIAPGQGFFVLVNAGATGRTFSVTEAMQSPSSYTFQKEASVRPEITVSVQNGKATSKAEIFFIDGTTTGFDNGYDSSIFSGVANQFAVYTKTIANDTDRSLGIQSLPNENISAMVIPVGVNAKAGSTLEFSAVGKNLPEGAFVYLEDKSNNTFNRIDNATYTTTTKTELEGAGQFYIHTSLKSLTVDANILENVNIYTSNNQTLKIEGIKQGAAKVKMYSVLGKQVMNNNFVGNGANSIALPKLQTGIYMVEVQSEFGKLNKKLIIK